MLNKLTFFDKLKPQNQKLIIESASFVEIPKNTILFNQGDVCKALLFMIHGKAKVVRESENAHSILLFYFEDGDQCNVNFVNNGITPSIGTGIAITDIEAYKIPSKIIAQIFINDEEFQKYIFEQYSQRIIHMANLVEEVRFKSLDLRLISWFKDQDSRIIKISHEELGDILGTSREVISRILKGFEKNNLVKLHRKKIELLEDF